MARMKVYYFTGDGARTCAEYDDVVSISAGTAKQVLGYADAIGNGIDPDAPLIQLELTGGQTATYDADHVYIATC